MKRTSSGSLVYSIMVLSILCINAFSQWQLSFTVNNAYDNNPFRSPYAEESWITSFDAGVQRNYESVSLSYIGSFTRFDALMDHNYYWHQAAVFGSFKKINWGGYVDQRINGTTYDIYDYNSFTVYINSQFSLLGINSFVAADFNLHNYSNLDEIDNHQTKLLLRLNKSFQTRTTFIAGAAIYYKKYTESFTTIESSGDSISHQGPGRGPGGGDQYSIYSEIEAPSVSQMQFWFRSAQSVFVSTGIAIEVQKRIMLSGINRFVEGIAYNYNEESEIFDDPMGYESSSIGGEMTQILPAGLILKTAYYYTEKDYITQGIYTDMENYDASSLRKDTFRTAWISLKKSFTLNSTAGTILMLRLYYQWLNNSSNSYWYNYDNNYLSVGFEFQI